MPQECVGYITGARRATLDAMEGEWGVPMFFIKLARALVGRQLVGLRGTVSRARKVRARRTVRAAALGAWRLRRPGIKGPECHVYGGTGSGPVRNPDRFVTPVGGAGS